MSAQGVTSAKPLLSRRNNVLEPTNTFVLTFGLPTPPKSLKAAYMKLDVEPYIPNPLRCYNCQRYGHGKATCNRKAVCAKCSQEGHQDSECANSPHCANCAGHHSAYSKDCPEWTKQKEITQLKFDKNISFGDAKKFVEQRIQPTLPRVAAVPPMLRSRPLPTNKHRHRISHRLNTCNQLKPRQTSPGQPTLKSRSIAKLLRQFRLTRPNTVL